MSSAMTITMSSAHSSTFRHFTYVTAHSPTLPLLHLRHSSFSNPSFASPTLQALHLIHLARRPFGVVIHDRNNVHLSALFLLFRINTRILKLALCMCVFLYKILVSSYNISILVVNMLT